MAAAQSRALYADGLVPTPPGTASYAAIEENKFRGVTEFPLSTFSVDVDTASYANIRRFLNGSQLPPADAVRVEELINYFKYDYPAPKGDAFKSAAFSVEPAGGLRLESGTGDGPPD